jgi:hypothetical protein
MQARIFFIGTLALALWSVPVDSADAIRLLKSLSGPSGKVVGNRFVLDEVRTRFVFPQDKSLVIYCEWEATPGTHTLVGYWKGPDGRTLSISPDMKIESPSTELNAYWTFLISPNLPSGLWTFEIRVDGMPAGSHPFELVVPPPVTATPEASEPILPTMDQIYRQTTPSLVWVHALDGSGDRLDTSDGFVYGPNLVATSFSAIDSAARLEIEFSSGRRVKTDEVLACSRLQDWALIRVDTAGVPALPMGEPAKIGVGERLAMFAVEGGARKFGGVDVAGKQSAPGVGLRILFSPDLAVESAGGPLLNLEGKVVGILGASLTPGGRIHKSYSRASIALWDNLGSLSAAVPINALPQSLPAAPVTLQGLLDTHVFTQPLAPGLSFLWGGTSDRAAANSALAPRYVTDFRANQPVWVEMMWQKREKAGKGVISAQVYDVQNRERVNVAPKKFSLNEQTPTRLTVNFPAANLQPGTYRIDVLWNDRAVWRTFFNVVE